MALLVLVHMAHLRPARNEHSSYNSVLGVEESGLPTESPCARCAHALYTEVGVIPLGGRGDLYGEQLASLIVEPRDTSVATIVLCNSPIMPRRHLGVGFDISRGSH